MVASARRRRSSPARAINTNNKMSGSVYVTEIFYRFDGFSVEVEYERDISKHGQDLVPGGSIVYDDYGVQKLPRFYALHMNKGRNRLGP